MQQNAVKGMSEMGWKPCGDDERWLVTGTVGEPLTSYAQKDQKLVAGIEVTIDPPDVWGEDQPPSIKGEVTVELYHPSDGSGELFQVKPLEGVLAKAFGNLIGEGQDPESLTNPYIYAERFAQQLHETIGRALQRAKANDTRFSPDSVADA